MFGNLTNNLPIIFASIILSLLTYAIYLTLPALALTPIYLLLLYVIDDIVDLKARPTPTFIDFGNGELNDGSIEIIEEKVKQ